jgi:hypothetical protein
MFPKNSLHSLLLALPLLAWVNGSPGFSGGENPAFPQIPGWTCAVDSMVYTPENLWNIIDGAADAYLLYGFVDLRTGEYRSPDSVDVRAELYKHSSPPNAFGIYSQERKPEYSFIQIGTEGYSEDGVLNFLCGTYYVKLTSHTTGPKGIAALRSVAETLVTYLHQENTLPRQLALLPSEGKIRRSESYIADSYLGYSFFRGAYVAQYDSAGKVQLFVMAFESPAAARAALGRYMETLKVSSKQLQDGEYSLADSNNGTIGVLLKSGYVCGVVNCENEKSRNDYLARLRQSVTAGVEPTK